MSAQDINCVKQEGDPPSGVFRGTTIIRRKIDHESPGPSLVPVNLTNGLGLENIGMVSVSNINVSSSFATLTAPAFGSNMLDIVVPNFGSKMINQNRINDTAYIEHNSGVSLPLTEDPISFQPIAPPVNHGITDNVSMLHETDAIKASVGVTATSNSNSTNSMVSGFGFTGSCALANSSTAIGVPAASKYTSNKPARFVVVRFQEYTNRWIHSHVSCKDRFMMERPSWLSETALKFVDQPVEHPVEECAIHRLNCHSLAQSCVMPPSMALLENDDLSRHQGRCTHGLKACRRRENLFLTSMLSSESVAAGVAVLPVASTNGMNVVSTDHTVSEDVAGTNCSSRVSISGSPLRQRRSTGTRVDHSSEDNEIQSRDNGVTRRRRGHHEDSMTEGDAEAIIYNRITDTTPISNKPCLVNPPVSPAQLTSQSRSSPVDMVCSGVVINSNVACSSSSTLTTTLATSLFSRSFQPATPASSLALSAAVISSSSNDSLNGTSTVHNVATALPVSAVLPQQQLVNRQSMSIGALDNPMLRYQITRSRSGSRRNVHPLNDGGALQQPQDLSQDSSHYPQSIAQNCNSTPAAIYPSSLPVMHDWYAVEQRVDARIAGITDMLRGAVMSAIRSEIDPCQMRMKQYVSQLQLEVATLTCTLRHYAPDNVYQEAVNRQASIAAACMTCVLGGENSDPSMLDSLLLQNSLNSSRVNESSSTLLPK